MFRTTTERAAAGGHRWLPASRRGRVTALAVAVAVAAGGTFAGVAATGDDGDKGPRVVAAGSAEAYETVTASDWVTHGDHAVVLSVVPGSEHKSSTPEDEKDNGEGHVPRTATMKVDEVLWSKPGAEPAPTTFEMQLLGWWWEGDSQREFAWQGEPRFEEGHKYIVLLAKGDGEWGATTHAMPYDNSKVGNGEIAGSVVSARGTGELEGLAKDADGKDAAAVKQLLNEAQPEKLSPRATRSARSHGSTLRDAPPAPWRAVGLRR
ncbi:hypothetical protein [Streptomyces sp. NPDC050428]|uniref:hypothetical protein n=1 Tax=Streptomyces sp. NPDC050428 TaxID=3155757 RepID=UPI00342EA0B4